MKRQKREINTSLLDQVTADMLGGEDIDFLHDDSLRVERILLELVRPDPLQPRRVLPDRIYQAFHADQMTPSQALRELIQAAQLAARQQGRPFSNVLEILGDPEDETREELPALSPEEQLVRDLVNLAITIRDDGQVNPLTVVDVSQGVTRQFRIETGERRYWATWLLRDFIPGYESDGMIPCIVIPHELASAFRQAKENTARSGLSAIAMARQAALLLLHVHGYEMPNGPVKIAFYRQAIDLTLRTTRGNIQAKLFGNGRHYNASSSADTKTSEIIRRSYRTRRSTQSWTNTHCDKSCDMPTERHTEIVQHIIQFWFDRKQVRDISKGD